jgi:hypothetical protein
MNASETELQTILPGDVIRLEHYEIPPARYAAYECVVNVVTRKVVSGFNGGLTLAHAFTTGFMNDQLYFKYNSGDHQFSLDYVLVYRDHRDQRNTILYEYDFGGVHYKKNSLDRTHFGYGMHLPSLTYTFQRSLTSLQLRLTPKRTDYHRRGESSIILSADDETADRSGIGWGFQSETVPVLDSYLSQGLSNGDEIVGTLVGTGFWTSTDYVAREFGGVDGAELLLNNDVKERNRKYSLLGEAYYSRKLSFGELNMGYSFDVHRLKSHVINTFGDREFGTDYNEHYVYVENVGEFGKFSYTGSLGVIRQSTSTYLSRYRDWIFRPHGSLRYGTGVHRVRLSFERKNNVPPISSLSDNQSYVTDHIISRGNPLLRQCISNRLNLSYTLTGDRFSLVLGPKWQYIASPWQGDYSLSSDYLVGSSINGNGERRYGLDYNIRYTPFAAGYVTLSVNGELTRTELFSAVFGHYAHLYSPVLYRLNLRYGKWSGMYQGRIVSYRLNGLYLSADENSSWSELRYSVRDNFSLILSSTWLFKRVRYHMYATAANAIYYESTTRILDSESMFLLGFSWSFSRGRTYAEKDRSLERSDTDSGRYY